MTASAFCSVLFTSLDKYLTYYTQKSNIKKVAQSYPNLWYLHQLNISRKMVGFVTFLTDT